jgi:hypothetical protein
MEEEREEGRRMEGRSGDPRGSGRATAKGLRRRRGEEREKEGMEEDGEKERGGTAAFLGGRSPLAAYKRVR